MTFITLISRFFIFSLMFGVCAISAHAQSSESTENIYRASVIEVADPVYEDEISQSGNFAQNISVQLLTEEYREIVIENDFSVLDKGDKVYIRESIIEGESLYSIYAIDRMMTLGILLIIFVGVVVLFGGMGGVRALLSLVLSIGIIFFVLMPVVAAGHSPIIWGIAIAVVLLAVMMMITHGLTKQTFIAFGGTSIAVIITGVIALIAVDYAQFTGIASDEAFYLSIMNGVIHMPSLLLAGIVIGMLGVLDDAAITQVAVVTQLRHAGVRGHQLYRRSMVVGREHVSALINTLILAYAGASLPLFLLLATYNEPLGALLNLEVIAIEIIRAIVGSIGLVLAVPITTFLATFFHTEKEKK